MALTALGSNAQKVFVNIPDDLGMLIPALMRPLNAIPSVSKKGTGISGVGIGGTPGNSIEVFGSLIFSIMVW